MQSMCKQYAVVCKTNGSCKPHLVSELGRKYKLHNYKVEKLERNAHDLDFQN